MKKLCIMLLLFSPLSFAGWGDVYYCQMTDFSEINLEGNQKNYALQKFQFKLDEEQNAMVFGKGGFFNDANISLDYEYTLTAAEKWRGESAFEKVIYREGRFLYSMVIFDKITSLIANCDKF